MSLIHFIKINLLGLVLSFFSPVALADDNVSAKMKRLLIHYDKILTIPEAERSLIRPAYRVKARGVPQSDIEVWYVLNGERYDFILDHRGVLQNLPDKATYDANPRIYTNMPRKNIVLAMRIRPNIPLTMSMDAQNLRESLAQARKGMKRATGLARIFRPKLRGYDVELPAGAVGSIHYQNGDTRALQMEPINETLIRTIIREDLLENANFVSFSTDPTIMRYYSGR